MHFEDPPDLGVSGVRKDLSFSFRADSEILKNRRLEKATLRVVFFLLLSEIRTAVKKLLARHRYWSHPGAQRVKMNEATSWLAVELVAH